MKPYLLLLLFATSSFGATYFVRQEGSDSTGTGSSTQPWRTIQKGLNGVNPGDTLAIGPGDFHEYVQTIRGGTAGQRITITSEAMAGSAPSGSPTQLRAIRIIHPFYTIQGLTFNGASDSHKNASSAWASSIRIEAASHGTIVRSNIVRDTPSVIASDFQFGSAENTITTRTGDFLAAGFLPQSHIYLGACSLLPYTNHNTAWLVSRLTKDTLWVTNAAGDRFEPDPGTNYWAAIHAGGAASGMTAIAFIPANGTAATNCQIIGNTVTNNFGSGIDITGDGHLIEGNRFTKLNSFYGSRIYGKNLIIRSNIWIDLPTILWYTVAELNAIPHPAGSGWYDYQDGTFHSVPRGAVVTNVLFESNWIQNSENQLGTCGYDTSAHTAIYRKNVFVGVGAQHNNGRDNMQWINNTFYKCSYDVTRTMVIATGGSTPSTIINGINISSNLFIACGDHSQLETEGFYTITSNVVNTVTDWNMVAGPEVTGWRSKRNFSELNGVNGGNPVFRDEFNPLGPDGIPFTADDGLRPLPNSPAAIRKIGALEPAAPESPQHPIAHFSVVAPTGWHEPVRGNYDLAWLTKTPWERMGPQRPFGTIDSLPAPPSPVIFSAADSFPNSTSPIVEYSWNFGDGTSAQSTVPTVTHTFNAGGEVRVSLTVRNAAGLTSTSTRVYRLPAAEPTERPLAPTGLRVVTD